MSDFIEFTAKTTEEALHQAAAHFQLPLGRLEVEVVSAGSSGLFGFLGAKKAKVRVRPQAGPGLEQEMAELAATVSDNHRPRSPRPAPEPQAPPQALRPPAKEAFPQAAPPPQALAPAPAPVPSPPSPAPALPRTVEPAAQAATRDDLPEVPSEILSEDLSEDLEDGEALPGEPEDETPGAGDQRLEQDPQVLAHALEVLTKLVSPLDATATVSAQAGPQGIELAVQGQEAGVLIGRRGQNLEALQYLVTRIVSHRCGRPVRIIVDAGEYRRRRQESLEDLARRMAQKARQSQRPVAVGPLSAQERRVVHMTLKGEPGLTTSSRGRGELKKVVISPKGGVPAAGQ
jgi:spoIIIJ-associated protein